jgi:hypothetical protein
MRGARLRSATRRGPSVFINRKEHKERREVPELLLHFAVSEIFVVPKKRARATGSGPQAAESLPMFTARNSNYLCWITR